jgi:hypothetical protein
LVVRVDGKDFGFFGGNSGITLYESGHDTSGSLNTGGKGGNVEEEKVLSLLRGVTGKNGSQHHRQQPHPGDAIVGLLAIEKVGNKLDDTRYTSGTTDQDSFMDV